MHKNIGKYVMRDSLLHKANFISKFVLTICIILGTFITNNYFYFTILLTTLLCLAFFSKVSLVDYLKDISSIWFLMLLAFLLQIINNQVNSAFVSILRILVVVFTASIFMRSTKPTEIARSFEKLFRFFGMSATTARDFSTTITLVLRFFPLMIEEIDRIRISQTLRGINLSRGGVIKRLSGVVTIIIPAVISTINRAEQLATAMETKRYGLFQKTSSYYDIKFRPSDAPIIALSILLLYLAFLL